MFEQWNVFKEGKWQEEINVQDFIQKNYTPYNGNDSFLEEISLKTTKVWDKCIKLIKEETIKGVMDIEVNKFAGIDNYEPGYIDKKNEIIFGLQTDAPLKRIVNPYGGTRLVRTSLEAYGYKMNENVYKTFLEYRKTHNQGVFDAYTKEMLAARSSGLLTGLPDAYGRGRIIGDYRRVPLYGVDYLINKKMEDRENLRGNMLEDIIRQREEVSDQIKVLKQLKSMALKYGYDISLPASNAKEAVQYLYFGYLAAVKENNGAAMSLGRTSTFLDIYIERDFKLGLLNEKEAQELIDQFIIKLRLVRHLRTPEYDELFAGDPTWITESIGGVGLDKRSLVTKNSYRYLHSLINLGSAPEPNMTILWSKDLPDNFKKYCAEMTIKTDALQYENDDLMRPIYGDDYAIACCVSAMTLGKQMQYFGARTNIAKALLYAINGGVDEITGKKVIENIEAISDDILEYDKVLNNYNKVLEYLADLYVNTMNIIHYMHDKYAYEREQMALHDTKVERLMAFGMAGLSVAVDSLSAIKYAKVKPIRNEKGITTEFSINGNFPKYGNDDDKVDDIAKDLVEKFSRELKKHKLYRNAKHTLSILTITSNVVYGEKTGSTPDGRKLGEPFAPGANPMHGRDSSGALASLNSVAKLKYCDVCEDGISNTFSIVPDSLGKDMDTRINNLISLLDGYFNQDAHHLNVNVLTKEKLIQAQNNPLAYPLLTIRVSGYAVHFNRLTKQQQDEVISRTFHSRI
jgi:formate C-acetyltransferase